MRRHFLALALCFVFTSPLAAQQSVQVPATMFSVPIPVGVQSQVTLVKGLPGESIYVTSLIQAPVATAVVTYSYGTGTNCGTGTGSVTAAMTFASGAFVSAGSGNGALMVVPQGNDLCITIGTAGAPGILTYAQY